MAVVLREVWRPARWSLRRTPRHGRHCDVITECHHVDYLDGLETDLVVLSAPPNSSAFEDRILYDVVIKLEESPRLITHMGAEERSLRHCRAFHLPAYAGDQYGRFDLRSAQSNFTGTVRSDTP